MASAILALLGRHGVTMRISSRTELDRVADVERKNWIDPETRDAGGNWCARHLPAIGTWLSP